MEHPFERLLLATERTEFDVGAERFAIELARRCGRPLMAVLPLVSNAEYEAVAPELAARADLKAAERLADLRATAKAAGVRLEPHVRRGDEPWREIVAEAAARDADLVIVRRRGQRSFLANLLVGDMVTRIAAHARASILMVPRGAPMWQRRVLAAIDTSPGAERVAEVAAAVARRCALPLRLVCVADDARSAYDAAAASLARACAAIGGGCDGALRTGKPAEQILAEAAASGADLIVIGTGSRGLGPTAEKVIGLGQGPVLAVR